MSFTNILGVYNLANTADRFNGARWYPEASMIACDLVERYGVSYFQAVGVIAALSPRNKWERNLADAENLIKVFLIDAESVDSVKVCTFSSNKAKAIRILSDKPTSHDAVLAILSGPKLQEFYSCIVGINDEVCIDGHAYSVWAGDRITLADIPKIGKKLRQKIKADYREAARQAGISADEMQAVTWCAWRRIHGVV